jgi:hypothetical protein
MVSKPTMIVKSKEIYIFYIYFQVRNVLLSMETSYDNAQMLHFILFKKGKFITLV